MVSFKSFITAIHDAILRANDAVMDKNLDMLNRYFDETPKEVTDDKGAKLTKKTLVPKSVILEYPNKNEDGSFKISEVHVPLITLVPLSNSQIEKATLVSEFEMEIINDELQINFTNGSKDGFFKKSKAKRGRLEIVISPQETSEGLKLLVEGYEAILRRQIS